jgi:hypothetical protein
MMKNYLPLLAVFFIAESKAQVISPPVLPSAEYRPGYQNPIVKGIEISPFRHGYARIIDDGKEFYIDVRGAKAFDYLVGESEGKLGDKYHIEDYQKELLNTDIMPKTVIPFVKDGKTGVLAPDGKVILPAKYDQVDLSYQKYWTLSLNGRQSAYLPGGMLLPFFDEINYLDGRYFDVKQGQAWGIYDSKKKKIAIGPAYEAFDYCGGCTMSSEYVYAKKDGKWGIIDFDGKVRIPFEYDHQHQQMRSDNWVQSFSKNNIPVIVNIKSRQEFVVKEGSTIAKGLLIYTEKGKFGAYDQDGKLVVPFIYDRIDADGAGANQKCLIITEGKHQGAIDLSGKIVVPLKYDQVKVSGNYFILKRGNKTILAGADLSELRGIEDGEITYLNGSEDGGINPLPIFRIAQKAFFGLYFANTNVYHEPQFYNTDLDHKAGSKIYDLIVGERQGIKTIFDLEGNILLPGQYQSYTFLAQIGGQRVQVKRDEKIGIYKFDSRQEVIPAMYRDYFDFIGPDGQTVVCRSGDYESPRIELRMLSDGKLLTERYYSEITSIDSITFLLGDGKSNQYALYNAAKKMVTILPYKFVGYIGSKQVLAVSGEDGKAKLYNFQTARELNDGYYFSFRNDPVSASVDRPMLYRFKNGMAMIGQHNKLGYIDETGRVIVPTKYDKASDYDSLGVAIVTIDSADSYRNHSKMGFVDKLGKFVIPMASCYENAFNDNFFLAGKILLSKYNPESAELKFGLVDRSGKVLLDPIYDQISPTKDDKNLLVKKGRKFGVTDANGKWVVPLKYDDLGYGVEVVAFPMPVKEGDKWIYLTENGQKLPVEGDRLIGNP